jgi:hypothetical protein
MKIILRHLVVIGTCHWITPEQCCDRNEHLLYVFDWETNTWQDEYITPASTGELAGASVEISSLYLNESMKCTNIKWPKCIQNNVDYVSGIF